jgi:DNA ligase-3
VEHIKEFLPKACKTGTSAILDGEILLWDTKQECVATELWHPSCTHRCGDRNYLPFGTLGVNKKQRFADATVCLVIFDLLYFNGTGSRQTQRLASEGKPALRRFAIAFVRRESA